MISPTVDNLVRRDLPFALGLLLVSSFLTVSMIASSLRFGAAI
jgi:hypothetical protein